MSEAQHESVAAFIARLGITATVEAADSNPNWQGDTNCNHWRVKFARRGDQRHTFATYFSKGPGHRGAPPTADDVLDCLAVEAASVVNARDFDDWCADFGYSTDSREAERLYRATLKGSKQLRRFLGDEFDNLLFETERL